MVVFNNFHVDSTKLIEFMNPAKENLRSFHRAAYGAAIATMQQNLNSGSFELGENALDYTSINQLLKGESAS